MIDKELYSKIHELLPIACLDLVILHQNKILLVKRNRKPAKDQYWLPGGRILRNETFTEAAKRLALGEAGIQVDVVRTLGADNLIFTDDPFGHGQGTHTISCIVECIPITTDVKVDSNHDGFIWWNPSDKLELDNYVTRWSSLVL